MLTNLFFFELKDDILTSSNEIDKYKVLKYNNIVTYFIFIILTELNTGQIFGLKDEKVVIISLPNLKIIFAIYTLE